MKTWTVSLLIVAAAAAAAPTTPSTTPTPDVSLDSRWQRFKAEYRRHYAAEEEAARRKIWERNVRIIDKHNAKFRRGETTFTMAENHFTDKTIEEMKKYLRYQPRKTKAQDRV